MNQTDRLTRDELIERMVANKQADQEDELDQYRADLEGMDDAELVDEYGDPVLIVPEGDVD
jgi:hypothetical protein